MREQGIAANATPRAVRGENKKKPRDGIFKAQRYGESTALRDRVIGIAKELSRSKTVADPARERLLDTRKSLVSTWMKAAEVLDAQGEIILVGDRVHARDRPDAGRGSVSAAHQAGRAGRGMAGERSA